MQHEHVFIHVDSESGDLALRELAFDLLARGWVLRASLIERASLTLSAEGERNVSNGGRGLTLLCEASGVDRVFEHMGHAVHAVAVPAVRVTM